MVQDLSGTRTLAQGLLLDTNRAGVTFLNDQQLIVYEVDQNAALSSRLSPDVSSAFQLHAYVLDAATGKLDSTKDWPTRAHSSSVQATSGGVMIRTGEVLILDSENFVEIASMVLPGIDKCRVSISPSHKTVMINCLDEKVSHFDVLDGDTFRLKYSWAESPPLSGSYSISDTSIVTGYKSILSEFASRTWNAIGSANIAACSGNVPTFVTNELMVRACREFSLMSINGQTLMSDPFPKGDFPATKIAIAQDGRLVAVSLDSEDIKKHLFTEPSERLIATHLVVYDLLLKKRVLAVAIAPLPKNDYDFAMSLDGSKLAILNDRKVTVCSVPVQ